jgi:intracellular septation protein
MAWSAFFIFIGAVNLYVAHHFEESVWVNFKLFGMLGLTIVFVLLQSVYLAKHMPETAAGGE